MLYLLEKRLWFSQSSKTSKLFKRACGILLAISKGVTKHRNLLAQLVEKCLWFLRSFLEVLKHRNMLSEPFANTCISSRFLTENTIYNALATSLEKEKRRHQKRGTLGPFIRGKIRRAFHKTRTFRINGTFRLK